eukprot:4420379-Ditylum_brightwellii.AAC.1
MEIHCKSVANMQLKDPNTPPYFETSEHTHHEVIITHESVEGEISKLKGQENQLKQKVISLTLNDRAAVEDDSDIDKESILDMNGNNVNMDNLADNMV